MNIFNNDYFSSVSKNYARFRPVYPAELFNYLASLCSDHQLALDCATGNGQSAVELASFFNAVIATDISKKQLDEALVRSNIIYQLAPAELLPVDDQSLDLITVAQALHWFNLDAFYSEVYRTLKPTGIIAVWTYNLLEFQNIKLNQIIHQYYYEILGKYWTEERKSVECGYSNLSFPFQTIDSPKFKMTATWSFDHLIGYLGTWSASTLYKKEHSTDSLLEIIDALQHTWNSDKNLEKTVTWELTLLVGRCIKSNI